MKKKILIGIITMILGIGGLNAQRDGFFTSDYTEYREYGWDSHMPLLPDHHGSLNDFDADEVPLGSGLLILGALAAGYRKLKVEN